MSVYLRPGGKMFHSLGPASVKHWSPMQFHYNNVNVLTGVTTDPTVMWGDLGPWVQQVYNIIFSLKFLGNLFERTCTVITVNNTGEHWMPCRLSALLWMGLLFNDIRGPNRVSCKESEILQLDEWMYYDELFMPHALGGIEGSRRSVDVNVLLNNVTI